MTGGLTIALTELGNQQQGYWSDKLITVDPKVAIFKPDSTITSRFKGKGPNPLLSVTGPILGEIKLASGLRVFEFPHPTDPAVIIGVDGEKYYLQRLFNSLLALVGNGIVGSVMYIPSCYRG